MRRPALLKTVSNFIFGWSRPGSTSGPPSTSFGAAASQRTRNILMWFDFTGLSKIMQIWQGVRQQLVMTMWGIGAGSMSNNSHLPTTVLKEPCADLRWDVVANPCGADADELGILSHESWLIRILWPGAWTKVRRGGHWHSWQCNLLLTINGNLQANGHW